MKVSELLARRPPRSHLSECGETRANESLAQADGAAHKGSSDLIIVVIIIAAAAAAACYDRSGIPAAAAAGNCVSLYLRCGFFGATHASASASASQRPPPPQRKCIAVGGGALTQST